MDRRVRYERRLCNASWTTGTGMCPRALVCMYVSVCVCVHMFCPQFMQESLDPESARAMGLGFRVSGLGFRVATPIPAWQTFMLKASCNPR